MGITGQLPGDPKVVNLIIQVLEQFHVRHKATHGYGSKAYDSYAGGFLLNRDGDKFFCGFCADLPNAIRFNTEEECWPKYPFKIRRWPVGLRRRLAMKPRISDHRVNLTARSVFYSR